MACVTAVSFSLQDAAYFRAAIPYSADVNIDIDDFLEGPYDVSSCSSSSSSPSRRPTFATRGREHASPRQHRGEAARGCRAVAPAAAPRAARALGAGRGPGPLGAALGAAAELLGGGAREDAGDECREPGGADLCCERAAERAARAVVEALQAADGLDAGAGAPDAFGLQAVAAWLACATEDGPAGGSPSSLLSRLLGGAAAPDEGAPPGAEAPGAAPRGSADGVLGRLLGSWGVTEQRGAAWFEVAEVLLSVGTLAGLSAARHLSEAAASAAQLRPHLRTLKEEQPPFIYVCGGKSRTPSNTAERFCLKTWQWEALPPMHIPRRACAVATVHGKFYVLGGVDITQVDIGRSSKYQPESYDPATNRWELLSPLARPCTHAAAAAAGGLVYLFGGLSAGCVLDQAQYLDPACDLWESLEPLPTPRFECTAVTSRGQIYVLGGSNQAGVPLAVAERYDLAGDAWGRVPPMHQARYGCAASAVAGRIYALGGRLPSGAIADAEVFDPGAGAWERLPRMPVPRGRCGAAALAGRVLVLGGGAGEDSTAVDCFDTVAGQWQQAVASMPRPRGYCAAVAVPA